MCACGHTLTQSKEPDYMKDRGQPTGWSLLPEADEDEVQADLRAEIGSACRSSSSVGGGYFSGRMRCRNDTGRTVSDCSHLSDTT